MTLMIEKNRRERIIVESIMAASRMSGDNGVQLYLLDLYNASGESFGRAVAMFYSENVGLGESFSGPDYEGINWERVMGDLFTFYLPDLSWKEDRAERDQEEARDLMERIEGLQGGYRFH